MAAAAQPVWNARERAEYLSHRRDALVRRLPARVRIARKLTRDLHELIVDDAIEWVALSHHDPVPSGRDLERVFWDAARRRALQAADGRRELVRAGHTRVEPDVLEQLGDGGAGDPARLVEAEADLALAREFIAGLDEREQQLLRARFDAGGKRPAGYKVLARVLGWQIGEVRSVQARVEHKLERFAVIATAGRVCASRGPAIAALAAGDATDRQRAIAHAHLEACPACTLDYNRHLHYLRSARFQDQVAQLLPPITIVGSERRTRTGTRDLISDWIARVLGHDAPATAAQLAASGAGRGLGTAAALKLATLCTGGAITACVATGVLPLPAVDRDPAPRAAATPTPASTPYVAEPRLPHGAVRATPTPTPKPKPKRKRSSTKPRRSASTQGATGERGHEQRPASPAPANAAPGGASEFDPTFVPDAPAAPAPVPAAPGASEFN